MVIIRNPWIPAFAGMTKGNARRKRAGVRSQEEFEGVGNAGKGEIQCAGHVSMGERAVGGKRRGDTETREKPTYERKWPGVCRQDQRELELLVTQSNME
jgi:hypothetical protein